jgi:MFS superfamily sulfate permease-like transporter
MSVTADVMAVVLFLFFAVGVAVGVVVVIALSARRADQADRWSRQGTPTARSGYSDDDEQDDEPPWWQTRGDD